MLQTISQPLAAAMILVTARVSGICLVAPVFSAAVVPIRLRLAMAVAMAMALVTIVPLGPVPLSAAALGLAVVCELAVGATIGYAARLIFTGVELGAFHIGQQMGFSLSESFRGGGASGESAGAVRPLMWLVAMMVFLAVGGHREVIMALRKSFQLLPLAAVQVDSSLVTMVTAVLAVSFTLAIKVAAAVLVAMLLAAVALGMLQRTMPQYNTLSVGLPIRIMVGMLVMAAALAAMGPLMEQAIDMTFTRLSAWMGGG